MKGAFLFTLIVAVVAVGFFLFSDNLVTTTKMSGKIQKSYTTQDPVLVRKKLKSKSLSDISRLINY